MVCVDIFCHILFELQDLHPVVESERQNDHLTSFPVYVCCDLHENMLRIKMFVCFGEILMIEFHANQMFFHKIYILIPSYFPKF